jgi:hypothetical protein
MHAGKRDKRRQYGSRRIEPDFPIACITPPSRAPFIARYPVRKLCRAPESQGMGPESA